MKTESLESKCPDAGVVVGEDGGSPVVEDKHEQAGVEEYVKSVYDSSRLHHP